MGKEKHQGWSHVEFLNLDFLRESYTQGDVRSAHDSESIPGGIRGFLKMKGAGARLHLSHHGSTGNDGIRRNWNQLKGPRRSVVAGGQGKADMRNMLLNLSSFSGIIA